MTARIAELEELIQHLDTLYEAGEECIHPVTKLVVTDADYDKLRRELEQLHPDSELLKTPTASQFVSTLKKVRHDPPMTSISKAIGSLSERQEILKKFQEAVKLELNYNITPEEWSVQAYKRDGVAIALYYEQGKLVRAGLRPRNGVDGEDVTEQIQYVEGVPTELWEHDSTGKKIKFLPVTCSIRGELECKKSVFNKIVEDWENPVYDLKQQPKNPRNYTAGSIRQFSNPQITKARKLSFVGYSIVGWHTPDNSPAPFKTEIQRAKYSNAVLRVPFVQVRPYRSQDLQMLENLANSLDYEVDGVVISVNNLEDAEQMGNIGNSAVGNPKAKLAWKFAEQVATTRVKNIIWQVGRSGSLTPVLQIDPVQLDGTTVSQVTGHSLGFLNGTSKSSLGVISESTEIQIIKSGKIIPKVVKIVKPGWKLHPPTRCPSCRGKLYEEIGDEGSELVCRNDFCGVRAVAKMEHYLATFGVKGVAESTLEKLLELKIISDASDLYNITVDKLIRNHFTKRQALLIVSRIWLADDPAHMTDEELEEFIASTQGKNQKVAVPAWQFIASLGIPGAGKIAAQALISTFGTFEAVRKAKLADLIAVADIGDITANEIYNFFQNNKDMIDSLLENVKPTDPKKGKWTGTTFVFTGGFPGGKGVWEKKVMDHGAKVSSSVSKTTTYVVVGTDAGSKADKAKQLGITQLSIADLEKML